MEASFTRTISSGLALRPVDLVAVKAMWSESTDRHSPVEQKSLEHVLSHGSDGSNPQFYAWERSSFRFNTQSGSVAGVYYIKIDALADHSTNWLLTFAPDLYIAAVIAEHAQYAIDPSALEWASKTAGLIDSLNAKDAADRFSGNSLVVRVA